MNLIRKTQFSFAITVFMTAVLLFSCKKNDPSPSSSNGEYTNGLLVLNEGLFNQNNASLSWVNLSNGEVENEVFYKENNRKLGDTGNDMIRYGGKIYIAVNVSSTVEVMDAKTLKSKAQIPFHYGGQPQEPRQLSTWENKVVVTSFDGYVSVIDTTNLTIEKRIKVGRNPEGIDVHDNFAWVTNSGGLDFNNPDSTVMKIDLITKEVVDTFTVGKNPGDIAIANDGTAYVIIRGDFAQDDSEIMRLNTENGTIEPTSMFASTMTHQNNLLFLAHYNYETGKSKVSIYDTELHQMSAENFIDENDITTIYGVFPYKENQILCIDAMEFVNSGYIKIFHESGSLVKEYKVGLNPNTILPFE